MSLANKFKTFGYRDVKLEYKALKEKVKEFNKKDAKFYGNMFAKLNKMESADLNVSLTVFCILYSYS